MTRQTYHEETVFKPLSDLEAAIVNTSPADMLLFMIALNRKEQEEQRLTADKKPVE